MQISLWGKGYAISLAFVLVAFDFIVRFAFAPRSCTHGQASFGAFIEKVGGRFMLKEPKMTWLMRGQKLIIELSTSMQNFADLQSFS